MRSVHRFLRILTVTLLIGAGVVARANASPIVSIDPVSQTASVGDTVIADIVVSGLTDPIGGFSALLSFNDSILSGNGFANDPDAKMGAAPLDLSGGFSGGSGSPLDLFFVADASLDGSALSALEGSGFRLATIKFLASANGVSPLTLSNVVLSNADGSATIPNRAVSGQVCVGGCPAPEPATLTLFGAAGVSALLARRRRSRAAKA